MKTCGFVCRDVSEQLGARDGAEPLVLAEESGQEKVDERYGEPGQQAVVGVDGDDDREGDDPDQRVLLVDPKRFLDVVEVQEERLDRHDHQRCQRTLLEGKDENISFILFILWWPGIKLKGRTEFSSSFPVARDYWDFLKEGVENKIAS